jgi:hypothetical protein
MRKTRLVFAAAVAAAATVWAERFAPLTPGVRSASLEASGIAGFQASSTWTGRISDSMCKAKHEEAAEGAGRMADRDCTISCVRGGSKYVLMVDGKVYQIANQSFGDLEKYAGTTVSVSGELNDDAITIAKIEPAKNSSEGE